MRALAAAHTVWGSLFLALAAWVAIGTLRILAYMSTGTVLTNLPIALAFGIGEAAPIAMLGVWMIRLGAAVRRNDGDARTRVLRAHAILLTAGLALVWLGVAALRAAAESAARGGGLLGGIGYVPLAFGGCLAVVSASALAATYYVTRST